ncbi:hypothetical protein [Tautonia plasticadhaerens]|uniref:hypothetical protein n=1 Tax=Tautonia plasticadhaerens TaxID=2527974 RepID=UPI0011A9F516|nr:hypothetical protein [Tautonia plasticadhaerens]
MGAIAASAAGGLLLASGIGRWGAASVAALVLLGAAVLWVRIGAARPPVEEDRADEAPDRTPPARPRDDRPADGEVGVVAINGVVAESGGAGPEFRRFLALEPGPGEVPFRSFRIWGRRFPPLLGKVALVSVFLGRDGTPWSDDEILKAHRALRRAGAWIEREAIRWQVPVNVDLADTYFSGVEPDADREVAIFRPDEWGGVGLPDPDAEARILGILGRTAGALGFADPVDLLGRIGRRIEADQVVWLLHVRRAGKSIALPSDATGIPGVAVAACYAREEDFEAPLAVPPFADPITFVHELMHLFGAEDKYGVSLSTFPRGTVSERDVMVLGLESLSRLHVEPMTAVEIGWAVSPSDRPRGPSIPLRGAAGPGNGKRPRRPR